MPYSACITRIKFGQFRRVPGRTTWTQCVVLPGTHCSARCMHFKSWHQLQPIANLLLDVLFVEISYQARFCLQISNPAILFTRLVRFFNLGILLFTSFCREQAKRSRCDTSCRARAFTSFCQAHKILFLPYPSSLLAPCYWAPCCCCAVNHRPPHPSPSPSPQSSRFLRGRSWSSSRSPKLLWKMTFITP